jgi:hypothetical protein
LKPETNCREHKDEQISGRRADGANTAPVFLCMALLVLVLSVYQQVGNHQFFVFDDLDRVTNNPHIASGITGANIRWAFTAVEGYNWHPLTWLSHMSIAHFFGMNPRFHHLANVAIHGASVLLLFALLCRVTAMRWQSLCVAALFALHPLHVESVAWVAERKDGLSAFFWFLTLFLYAGYVAKPQPLRYLLTLLSFLLGLMSKPMLVTLPIVMLLFDFWPLGRYSLQQRFSGRIAALIKEKIPFFLCAIGSGIVTLYAQHQGGVMRDLTVISVPLRVENALVAYVGYIGKTIWPRNLAVLYPLPLSIPLWQVIVSSAILLLLSVAAVRQRQRYPFLLVGWFWFLIALTPVIGLIQVGAQSMADRYMYIPAIGLYIIVVWGVTALTAGLTYRRGLRALLAGVAVTLLASLTWRQLGYWRDSTAIFRHTLQVTSNNAEIHYNLGRVLHVQGQLDAAIQQYREALRINPKDLAAGLNMGACLQDKGDFEAAISQYRAVLRLDPNNYAAHTNLGTVFARSGNAAAASFEYQQAQRNNGAVK